MQSGVRKEDGPQYHDEVNQQIWEALDSYFANAGADSYSNMRLIRPAIEKFGGAIALAGFAWVAERLEHGGLEVAKAAKIGVPNAILTHNIIAVAKNSMRQLKDIVNTDGYQAGEKLAASVVTAGDEDEAALTAYMLADGFASNMDVVHKEFSRIVLEGILKDTEGTSAKMAISWAIYNMGNKKPWEEMVYGDLFVQRNWVEMLEKTMKKTMPELKKEQIKDILCREYAVPGSTNYPIPSVTDKMGIFETLAIDIASNGQIFFKSYPNWTRKAES